MFQTNFNTTLQMFFIKLKMIFFQKPPKTLIICVFPCSIRYLCFKYFLNLWEKYWHESILQGYSKNHKIKMLFKTEKQNWNLNYLERLSFQPCFYVFWSCLNKIVFSNISWTNIHTRKKYTVCTITKNN